MGDFAQIPHQVSLGGVWRGRCTTVYPSCRLASLDGAFHVSDIA